MFLRFGIHEMKKMKDYYDLYLKRDALLLAVFQKFRNNSLKIYGLCPGHYWSAAALSWDAMLNMRAAELQMLTCICSLKQVREMEFLTFLGYKVKPTISI